MTWDPEFSTFKVQSSPGPGSTLSPLASPSQRHKCFTLPQATQGGSWLGQHLPPAKASKAGSPLVLASQEDVVGEGSDFSWLLSNFTKWGLAPMWVRAILGDLIPQHLLHAKRGARLFRGRAGEAARPCPLTVPLFCEFHFQILWH